MQNHSLLFARPRCKARYYRLKKFSPFAEHKSCSKGTWLTYLKKLHPCPTHQRLGVLVSAISQPVHTSCVMSYSLHKATATTQARGPHHARPMMMMAQPKYVDETPTKSKATARYDLKTITANTVKISLRCFDRYFSLRTPSRPSGPLTILLLSSSSSSLCHDHNMRFRRPP
ncbi:hypothetical protein VOLCADRAFT_98023 [Volvox carteri f. nagariensis]|uniref:Uncharacterized protein n=1 Tax=Volvox carteri f. nagariensis TaxID=3068 RepID=D8UE89_VOLCA|nr:uncharacterized protein VOLCADRAFT_98023 [Volvox carteri f. nagariensis]EFJ41963.1 hypothetical protein VOLCADRAFT_98023 [Volvox carteri f. nagariensis]|eukprot:XP_002957000.1 hypothetical protein VOLCADRAFT_98023 [Volvox carteri f. nagariensis]